MAATLDRQFFRKVTRRRRTLEFTANEVILPAVKDEPEIRVALPNRRERTIDERIEILAERTANVTLLDEEIETERINYEDLKKDVLEEILTLAEFHEVESLQTEKRCSN